MMVPVFIKQPHCGRFPIFQCPQSHPHVHGPCPQQCPPIHYVLSIYGGPHCLDGSIFNACYYIDGQGIL